MNKQEIIVIGAGAAGVMAAITAARNHAKVTILEHTQRFGKKLLATGNGRCNLTNLSQLPEHYRSDNHKFPMQVISQFNEKQTLQFFEEIGIYTKQKLGYVYPYSEQASAVLDLLKLELDRLHINIIYSVSIKEIKKKQRFQILTDTVTYTCDKVIMAMGSKAAPKTGSDGSGYALAKQIGHRIITPLPALVQLRCSGDYFKSLAGVRCEARLRLMIDKKVVVEDKGELQLTDYGISGIPTFQISRYAIRAVEKGKAVSVYIDFIPDKNEKEIISFLYSQIRHDPKKKMEDILIGLFNKKLVPVLLNQANLSGKSLGKELKEVQINRLIQKIKAFEVKVTSYNSFEQAQVCSGGVDTRELFPDTLESLKMPGIYLAGELLDVDGICGGYNLQWAWSSGYVAGKSASMS
ncbi:NAD(P)/FAD-dependent oxidoreductase [Candidatus Galacturonibacter soehngenii]|uniref:NAD(P)/FAD-dependent oxidoreductase n=1 Tax=Candidatus Galacturonatibacter soehngenii TaxID=2307010 RepID=A0A7V7QLX4_9FIRM|nr:NAD(P)/FAD-dependent oxidoreductase [Candidatus Galacturonibacter soehngenii]KAB1439584.1 NAD(P)/FAD-dependent oxidoreductase [Candidatus Galacturonibacter soehngenii]